MSYSSNFLSNFSSDLFSDDLVGKDRFRYSSYSPKFSYTNSTRLPSDQFVSNNFQYSNNGTLLKSRYSPRNDDFLFDSSLPLTTFEEELRRPIIDQRPFDKPNESSFQDIFNPQSTNGHSDLNSVFLSSTIGRPGLNSNSLPSPIGRPDLTNNFLPATVGRPNLTNGLLPSTNELSDPTNVVPPSTDQRHELKNAAAKSNGEHQKPKTVVPQTNGERKDKKSLVTERQDQKTVVSKTTNNHQHQQNIVPKSNVARPDPKTIVPQSTMERQDQRPIVSKSTNERPDKQNLLPKPTVQHQEQRTAIPKPINNNHHHHRENETNIDKLNSENKQEINRKIDKSKTQNHTWFTEEDDQESYSDERTSEHLPSIKESSNHQKAKKGKNDRAYRTAFQMRHDSYFHSLFQGSFTSRTSTNPHAESLFGGNIKGPVKHNYKAKVSTVPPGATRNFIPTAAIPSDSISHPAMKKQNTNDSTISRPTISDSSSRDWRQKKPDERYREALQKFRADRVEQQQRESNESTAKRLNYGNYVRHLTKDSLLQNIIKPLPWSDFVYYKKGNVYELDQQEKRELQHLSRNYAERVRQRNIFLNNGAQTSREERFTTQDFHQRNEPTENEEENVESSSVGSSNHSSLTTIENEENHRETSGNGEISESNSERAKSSTSVSRTLSSSTATDQTAS